jgi:hypothetical protein
MNRDGARQVNGGMGETDLALGGPGARFQWIFDRRPALLSILSAHSEAQVCREIEASLEAGCDGAFLAIDPLSPCDLPDLLSRVIPAYRDLWLGLRVAQANILEDYDLLPGEIQGIWVSDPGTERAEETTGWFQDQDWDCLLFGGLRLTERHRDDAAASAVRLSRFVDVLVAELPTSDAVGVLDRIHALKHAIGNFPLAIAADSPVSSPEDLTRLADCVITSVHNLQACRSVPPGC